MVARTGHGLRTKTLSIITNATTMNAEAATRSAKSHLAALRRSSSEAALDAISRRLRKSRNGRENRPSVAPRERRNTLAPYQIALAATMKSTSSEFRFSEVKAVALPSNGYGAQRRQGWPKASPDVRLNDVLAANGIATLLARPRGENDIALRTPGGQKATRLAAESCLADRTWCERPENGGRRCAFDEYGCRDCTGEVAR